MNGHGHLYDEPDIRVLRSDVTTLKIDVAVIRADLTNHVNELRADIHEVKSMLRTWIEHVDAPDQAKDWKPIALMVSGWTFGLLTLILEYLLRR